MVDETDQKYITMSIKSAPFKYKEAELLQDIGNYMASTYNAHYVTQEEEAVVQALDLIFSSGRGEGFCVGNILKYASRLGKKKTANERDDIMKIIHYSILTLYLYDKRKRKEMLADMDVKMPAQVVPVQTGPVIYGTDKEIIENFKNATKGNG